MGSPDPHAPAAAADDDRFERATVRMSDGVELFVARYRVERPRAVIVATHGLQSHHGWYGWSCRFLQDAGYEVWFVDRRGSGRSGGPRGHVRSVERLVADLFTVRAAIATERPCVLMAVCWAAKMALATTAAHPDAFDALILPYPALRTRFDPSLRQRGLLWLARWAGLARRQVVTPLRPEHFSNQMPARRFIEDDPLSSRVMSLCLAAVDRELAKRLPDLLDAVAQPTLALLSGRDAIVRNDNVRALLSRSPQVAIRDVEGAAHVLEFEPDREAIFRGIDGWLHQTLGV